MTNVSLTRHPMFHPPPFFSFVLFTSFAFVRYEFPWLRWPVYRCTTSQVHRFRVRVCKPRVHTQSHDHRTINSESQSLCITNESIFRFSPPGTQRHWTPWLGTILGYFCLFLPPDPRLAMSTCHALPVRAPVTFEAQSRVQRLLLETEKRAVHVRHLLAILSSSASLFSPFLVHTEDRTEY